jgi:2-dehydropantoate 2-reductase
MPVKAASPAEVRGPLDLVLLAVKSHATAAAAEQIAPLLGDASTVVSLQNGLNEEVIAARIGQQRTVGCLVNWGADWIAPGRVQFGGPGSLTVGELDGRITPRVEGLARLLSAVQPTRISANIWGCLWAKVCVGTLLFATALTDETVYDVVERSPRIQQALTLLVAETMRVAEGCGVRLEAFDEYDPEIYRRAAAGDRAAVAAAMAAVSAFYRPLTKVKTGVWRDLAVRKRKTEVDSQVGMIVEKGKGLGIPTPLTARLIELIHDLEDGRRSMGWDTLDELVALA